mgnify:CR=1 FL=1
MTAKEYLKQTDRLVKQIELMNQELVQLKLMSESIQAVQYGECIVSGTKSKDAPFVRCLIKISDLEEKIKKKNEELIQVKLEVSDVINELEDIDECILLLARYVNRSSWEDIYETLYCSKSTVHRLHSSALRNLKVPI